MTVVNTVYEQKLSLLQDRITQAQYTAWDFLPPATSHMKFR
jgi:hypothetical protein